MARMMGSSNQELTVDGCPACCALQVVECDGDTYILDAAEDAGACCYVFG